LVAKNEIAWNYDDEINIHLSIEKLHSRGSNTILNKIIIQAALLSSINKLAAPNTSKNKIINKAVVFLNFSRGTLPATPNLCNTVFITSFLIKEH